MPERVQGIAAYQPKHPSKDNMTEREDRPKLLDGAAGEAAKKLVGGDRPKGGVRHYDEYGYYDDDIPYRPSTREADKPRTVPASVPYRTDSVGRSTFGGVYYFSVVLPDTVGVSHSKGYGDRTVYTQVALTAHATEDALLDLVATLTAMEVQVRDALAKVRESKAQPKSEGGQ